MTLQQPFRQNAIAILAVIAATMIVAMDAVTNIGNSWDASESTRFLAENLLGGGINLLGLALGYCGLRISWKSVILLILVALTFDAVNLAVLSLAGTTDPLWEDALSSHSSLWSTVLTTIFFPISSISCRMVQNYFLLLVLSPLLNRGLSGLDVRMLRLLVIILSATVVFGGWLGENYLAAWHWSFYYFIYLYITGYFLSASRPSIHLSLLNTIIAVLACAIALAVVIYSHSIAGGPWTYWFTPGHANNIFSLAVSIIIFAYVSTRTRSYSGPRWLALGIFGTLMLISGPAATKLMDMAELSIRHNLLTLGVICVTVTTCAALISWIIYEPLVLISTSLARHLPAFMLRSPSAPLTAAKTAIRSSVRNSSIELARIIAMAMIMIEHLTFAHVAVDLSDYDPWGIILYGLTACCLSVYVILLGVLGLRLTWKSVINTWLTVLLFNLLSLTVLIIWGKTGEAFHSTTDIFKSLIFPIGSSRYWFIQAYLLLLTLAPLINEGLRRFDLRSLRLMVAMITAFGLYSGWLGGNPLNDLTYYYGWDAKGAFYPGEMTFYFIWLYSVGWWIVREPLFKTVPAWIFVGLFFLFSLAHGSLHLLFMDDSIFRGQLFAISQRQGLLVNLSAVAFVCFFLKYSFHNKTINLLGAATLGCYLIQESYAGFVLYDVEGAYYAIHGFSPSFWAWMGCSFIATWILATVIFRYKRRWMPALTDKIISWIPRDWKKETWQ